MTFLFVGGEDCDLRPVGFCATATVSGTFEPSHARSAMRLSGGGMTDGWHADLSVASQTFWFTGRIFLDYSLSYMSGGITLVSFYDAVANRRLFLSLVAQRIGVDAYYTFNKRNAAGVATVLKTSSFSPAPDASLKFDMFIDYKVSGRWILYVNEVLMLDYSGDLTTDGESQLTSFGVGHPAYSTGYYTYWSEIIVATQDTRTLRLITMEPDADGPTFSWSNAFNSVNEIALNDLNVNATTAADALVQYSLNGARVGGDPVIEAVVIKARVLKGATGPTQLQGNIRTGGVDYFSGTQSLQTIFTPKMFIWLTNPGTGLPWVGADITNANFYVGLKSIA